MSSKHYAYRIVESADPAELERELTSAGAEGWEAVGYGVLPNGQRSALLQRKNREREHGDHHRHHHHERHDEDDEQPRPAEGA